MIFIDAGVIHPREIEFVRDVIEIDLKFQVFIQLIGCHRIEDNVAGNAGRVLGIGVAVANRRQTPAY